uniref:Protein-glucosylgalactosylhydroxylysine glucosidase n=1 Tax=Ciona savignyi TaxID=51511 RepID=H2ZEB2_CIOSA
NKNDLYVLKSSVLPNNPRFYPTVANGVVGLVLFGDTMHMAGLYNGRKGESHRARIQSYLQYITTPHSTLWPRRKFIQHMDVGLFQIKLSGIKMFISQKIYAHKLLTNLLVSEITVTCKQPGLCRVKLNDLSGPASDDLNLDYAEILSYNSSFCNLSEETSSPLLNLHVYYSNFPDEISIINRSTSRITRTYVFLLSVGTTRLIAQDFYKRGMEAVSIDSLFRMHSTEWLHTWDSTGLRVITNLQTTQYILSSFYYLLSNFPTIRAQVHPPKFYGVSPGGLTNGGRGEDYWGHVFWDQDFWMAPALLPLYPDLVKKILKYRVGHLPGARVKAATFGYRGADYPWETAYTGLDVCPGIDYVEYEIHVTADIIHLLKQYIYATGDWDFLVEYTAEFWRSRVVWNSTKSRHVLNKVMGPDEWNFPVNNSAFTNAAAAQNLMFAADVAQKLGFDKELAKQWRDIAQTMFIPFDSHLQYHPEFDEFVPLNGSVKQADTIMLGFPLAIDIPETVRRNDLSTYAYCTSAHGPAMTWGMFSINLLDVDEYKEAGVMYRRQLKNIHAPFDIWSENADGSGAVNFLTGIGGYLQSILYGYLGLRYFNNSVSFNPTLIPGFVSDTSHGIIIQGFKYISLSLDVSYNTTSINI